MGKKNLYVVVGSLNHITYNDEGEQNGGGSAGEITLYIMGHIVRDVVEYAEQRYKIKRGNTEEYLSISSINEVDYLST